MTRYCYLVIGFLGFAAPLLAADGNRLTYLDEFCDPYYPHRDFPKLITPQWVGEDGVECVVVLAIDDMRDPEKYETYLRPILDRLKQVDGRAPVSIMTNQVDPKAERLQQWLKEGLSLEVHTFDHPCPCLAGGDFAKSKETYDKCVDLMHAIPNSKPVAFRMPCCDSLNTPSPRFWMEAFNKTTPEGHFLSIDSSVFNIITSSDKLLPKEITLNDHGEERFRRYVPFPSYVNTIEDYPYPYVIGKLCWQFPCVVPSDWSAQHVQKPNNPDTVRDLKLALDACVIKQGVYNLVFHPHGWIRNDQIVELIDHAVSKHGKKVKFLNFRECEERLRKNLLAGEPLRSPHEFKQDPLGGDNRVRILDVNNDGYMDVVVGEGVRRWTADAPVDKREGTTRVWDPTKGRWIEGAFPEQMDTSGPRFGVLRKAGAASMVGRRGDIYHFDENAWKKHESQRSTPPIETNPDKGSSTVDHGVRLRDFDHDNICECLDRHGRVYRLDSASGDWIFAARLPSDLRLASWHVEQDQKSIDDHGLRFIDLDGDHDSDIVIADEKRQGAWLFDSLDTGWKPVKLPKGFTIPLISREGKNNGAWFHSKHLWWQNENTNRLPNHVDRRSFAQLLGEEKQEKEGQAESLPHVTPTDRKSAAGQEATAERIKQLGGAKSPEEALKTIQVPQDFKVELVACEPLIVDPVAFDWGPDGRLWVVEMRDYPRGIDERGKPGGRVKVLTDQDGDDKYDTAQLFLDDLPFPTGIKVWRKGVLLTAAPDILYAEDTDEDGKADIKKILYRGFGEGNQQHRVNGLRWGMDGWLYVGNGDSGGKIESLATGQVVDISGRDLRIRPDTGEMDAISGATQFSLCFDDFGNRFGGNNSTPVWHYVLEDYHLRRNPYLKPPPVKVEISVTPGNARIYPISKTVTRFNDYQTADRFTSACGIEIYRDSYLGRDFYGNAFICEPVHNLVHREVVERQGISFTSRRAKGEEEREFLASTDNWFRPVMARTGPDGALYIADMYRQTIEHPTWIPEDWQKQLNLRAGDDKGRIYRVVRVDAPPRKLAALDKLDTPTLVAELNNPSGTRRDLVQQVLRWRADERAIPPLRQLATKGSTPAARGQALWTLHAVGGLRPEDVTQGLADAASVQKQAARIAALQFVRSSYEDAVIKLAESEDRSVQLEAVHALESWHNAAAARALANVAQRNVDDTVILASVINSLDQQNVTAFWDAIAKDERLTTQLRRPILEIMLSGQNKIVEMLNLLEKGDPRQSLNRRLTDAVEVLSIAKQADVPASFVPKLDDLAEQAVVVIGNASKPDQERIIACRYLFQQGRWRKPKDVNYQPIEKLLATQLSAELRTAIGEELESSSDFPFAVLLYDSWADRTQDERRQLFDIFVANEHASGALCQLLEPQRMKPDDIDSTRAQLLANHPNLSVQSQGRKLTQPVAFIGRAEIVSRYEDVLALRGDLARGRAAFRKRCTACHQQEGEGRQIGPNLASLTDKSSKALLTAMLDPNRAVEAKFLEYMVITDGGQLISGVVISETGTSITLLSADGKEHTVLRNEIELLRSNKKSLMPEGLERDLAKQDFADIIAYLQATAMPPKMLAGNTPALVKEDDGRLMLTATNARVYGPKLVFEEKYKNLGWWQTAEDVAEWSLEVPAAGKYRVTLDYACAASAAGDTLQLAVGGQTVLFKVESTGTWDDYVQKAIGTVELTAGPVEASLRSHGEVKEALLDLRAVRLEVVK